MFSTFRNSAFYISPYGKIIKQTFYYDVEDKELVLVLVKSNNESDSFNFGEKFYKLLNKLDLDVGASDIDYYSCFSSKFEEKHTSIWNSLILKLDADSGIVDTDYFSNLNVAINDNENILIDKFNTLLIKLDADTGITDIDYYSTLSIISI